MTSNIIFQISPLTALVQECEKDSTVTVSFRPTVPVVQDDMINLDYVPISIYVPSKFKKADKESAVDTCDLKLRTADIKTGKKIKIKGICDNQNEGTAMLEYHFAIANTHPFWGLYRFSSVKVRCEGLGHVEAFIS